MDIESVHIGNLQFNAMNVAPSFMTSDYQNAYASNTVSLIRPRCDKSKTRNPRTRKAVKSGSIRNQAEILVYLYRPNGTRDTSFIVIKPLSLSSTFQMVAKK